MSMIRKHTISCMVWISLGFGPDLGLQTFPGVCVCIYMYTRDKLNMLKFPGLYIYIYVGFCMRNPNLRSKTATYLHIHREISDQECIYIYIGKTYIP